MKIYYLAGDVTKPIGDGCKVIVHCCNDIGVMGAGVALAIANKWPNAKKAYSTLHKSAGLCLGQVQLVKVDYNIVICNLIGQRGVGPQTIDGTTLPPIRYEAIYEGLLRLRARISAADIPISIHAPRFGCGLAGGIWDGSSTHCILSCIKDVFEDTNIDIYVYDFKEPK